MEAHMARNRADLIAQVIKLTEMANRSTEATEADDENGVSHEDIAENAVRKVAKIMRRHQITEAEVSQAQAKDKEEFVHFKFSVSNSYGLGKERSSALHWAVIIPFGGNSMRTVYKSAKQDTEMTVFAPASIAEMLKSLLYSISLQMEDGLKTSTKEERKRIDDSVFHWTQAEINRQILLFRRGYLRGFGATVGSRIKAAQDEAMEEIKRELEAEGLSVSSSTEIALFDSSERAKDFMGAWYFERSDGGKLRTTTNRARSSSKGLAAGQRDGKRADIAPPKANNNQRSLV
jgi:hypothetical protein